MSIGGAATVAGSAMAIALIALGPAAVGLSSVGHPAGFASGAHVVPRTTSAAGSSNWGGYAVSTSNNAVSDVKGAWVVPHFKGACGGLYNFSAASFWVGIDGWSDTTVEQIGTSVECNSVLYISAVTYFAWYEFYPSAPVALAMTISPGDQVKAEVKYTSSAGFTVSIKDVTTGSSFSTSKSVSANRSSAEWIAEAPSSTSGVLPLVDFAKVSFTGCTATVSGSSHPVSYYSNYAVTMWNTAGTAKKATPSALGPLGTGFSVTWVRYGP
ncbi:MAG: G1 family endopeptidase [Thermoplasmata archaeon]|nr:G1 family endopeptidase [Thermoplasmata archaeon]